MSAVLRKAKTEEAPLDAPPKEGGVLEAVQGVFNSVKDRLASYAYKDPAWETISFKLVHRKYDQPGYNRDTEPQI